MAKTLTEVTRDAVELPAPERLKLARILLDLSETSTESPAEVEAAWDDEIARRLRELRNGEVKGVPLAEVKQKSEAGFQP
jgi:putative addiction module component (TIGR02574 family)